MTVQLPFFLVTSLMQFCFMNSNPAWPVENEQHEPLKGPYGVFL